MFIMTETQTRRQTYTQTQTDRKEDTHAETHADKQTDRHRQTHTDNNYKHNRATLHSIYSSSDMIELQTFRSDCSVGGMNI